MNIDYNAVIEILKSFLENEKTEILGISIGEERQVRDAIKNILTAYEKEKEKNKKARDMIEYYLIENNSLNDFDKRNKELKKLEKVLEE